MRDNLFWVLGMTAVLTGCHSSLQSEPADTATSPLCTDGESRCTGTMIQRCINDGWKDYDDCAVIHRQCGLQLGAAVCYESVADTQSSPENGGSTDSNSGEVEHLGTDGELVGTDSHLVGTDSGSVETDTSLVGTDSEPVEIDTGNTDDSENVDSGGCGDGLVQLTEECDDGNRRSGDGCDGNCQLETGDACIANGADADVIAIPVVYRDFTDGDEDFVQFVLTESQQSADGCKAVSTGMVADRLDDLSKPSLNPDYGDPVVSKNPDQCNDITSEASFANWYSHSTGDASVVSSSVYLWKNEDGDFVNRWLDDGTPWSRRIDFEPEEPFYQALWCGQDGDNKNCLDTPCADGEPFDVKNMLCYYPCQPWDDIDMSCAVRFDVLGTPEQFEGNPVFFPIDGQGTDVDGFEAKIPEQMYEGMKLWEESFLEANDILPPASYELQHNFFFTSEMRFWFQYNAKGTQRVTFAGNDDVWIFINNRLAVDLGGIHVPAENSVDIRDVATSHGLVHGGVYEIALFHANRRRHVSAFKLTLSGFDDGTVTTCAPECGDGIVALGEECDDGQNKGEYNGCTENCRLAGYCGDGLVQIEEDCDDGNFIEGDGCPTSCQLSFVP